MHILIAEDDATSRLILRKAVEHFGHSCVVAENGAEAWRLFQQQPADVVISDWVMPGMDGLELCHNLRSHPVGVYVYFIFLTALGEQAEMLRGIQAGADDYLSKPLNPSELQVRLLVAERVTALHRQLAEQKAALEQLNRHLFEQGRRDPLTQLYNRLQLAEDLVVVASHVERGQSSYAAVMCDIDRFKLYNDTYGHQAGDEIVRAVAQSMLSNSRGSDMLYRYGGEEFLLILPSQSLASAGVAIERLCRAIQALGLPHEPNQPAGVVTISAGIALLERDSQRPIEEWLREADEALYRAKQQGRNQVVLHHGLDRDSSETPRNT